jgi:hypothetical protein
MNIPVSAEIWWQTCRNPFVAEPAPQKIKAERNRMVKSAAEVALRCREMPNDAVGGLLHHGAI